MSKFEDDPEKVDMGADFSYSKRYCELASETNRLIHNEVMENGRIDILSKFVLGYDPLDHHKEMIKWQNGCEEGMLLAWRGAGKSKYCTISRVIFEILHNPNVRILLASGSMDIPRTFLREIKGHLEHNERFREIFGDFRTDSPLWRDTDITVNNRTILHGEPTVMGVGMGTTLPSRHYDIIICDDLVTADNALTQGQRKKIKDYYYNTLLPTLDPKGKLWVLGTRWHEEDLYGELHKLDFNESTKIIPLMDEDDNSRWPELFETEKYRKRRRGNPGAFELQYMCQSSGAYGAIFNEEHFSMYENLPAGVLLFQGMDLAIGKTDRHDSCAHVTLAKDPITKKIYLVDYSIRQLSFYDQRQLVIQKFDKYPTTISIDVESNNTQLGLVQEVKRKRPDIPAMGRFTTKDKEARAQQVSNLLIENPLCIRYDQLDFRERICGFPDKKTSKDLFDAFNFALNGAW